MITIYNSLLNYIKNEQDYRGQVTGKRWAHAVAHSADVLSSLAKYEQFKGKDLEDILDVIKSRVLINSYEYKDGEEGRMVVAVKDIMKRQLVDDEILKGWVQKIINYKKTGDSDEDSIISSNVEDFLTELYSVAKYMEEGKALVSVLEEFLELN